MSRNRIAASEVRSASGAYRDLPWVTMGRCRWRSDSGEVYVRWDDTRNVWFTGRIKGEWKIIAAFFPEVTPRTQS